MRIVDRFSRRSAPLALALFVAGCGGGSGDTPSASNDEPGNPTFGEFAANQGLNASNGASGSENGGSDTMENTDLSVLAAFDTIEPFIADWICTGRSVGSAEPDSSIILRYAFMRLDELYNRGRASFTAPVPALGAFAPDDPNELPGAAFTLLANGERSVVALFPDIGAQDVWSEVSSFEGESVSGLSRLLFESDLFGQVRCVRAADSESTEQEEGSEESEREEERGEQENESNSLVYNKRIFWELEDLCRDGAGAQVRFWEVLDQRITGATWPDDREKVYLLPSGSTREYSLDCATGTQVCYAAIPDDGSGGFWGQDFDSGLGECRNCCAFCPQERLGEFNFTGLRNGLTC